METNYKELFSRNEAIYGAKNLEQLKGSKVAVLGLGGVGSFCATALARAGIGTLTLVDFDIVELSNINRQEFAYLSTIGSKKTNVAKKLITDINPNIRLILIDKKITKENVNQIIGTSNSKSDFVVDAIDDIDAKIAIYSFVQNNDIPIISCMGMALRTQPDMIQYSSLYSTKVCPLCKTIRKKAKEANILDLPVVFSPEKPAPKNTEILGSTSFVPPIAGMMLAGYAINKIIST